METWKRNLWILWLGVILCSSSYTMVVPFLPLYVVALGAKSHVNIWAGATFSITFLIGALMAPFWGSLSDKYGRRSMIVRAGICLSVVYALGAVVQNPWELLAYRALHGLVSGFVPASIALVATNTPEKHMGWSLGIMQTASATGSILGPLLGGIFSHLFGMRMSFVIASVFLLVATIMVKRWVQEIQFTPAKKKSRILDDMKLAWHNRALVSMLLILMVVQISIMILEPLLSFYIVQIHGREGAELVTGIIFSSVGVATILSAPRFGRLGQAKGYARVLLFALLGAGIMNVMQVLAQTIWSFGGIRFVYGLCVAGVIPSINALVVERTEADFRGRAFGLTTSANQVGSMIGPMLGGLLGNWWNIHEVFVFTGGMLLVTGIAFWLTERKRAEVFAHYRTGNPMR
jgi:DHA1 family multidrug resistance protein-like MFS transporter